MGKRKKRGYGPKGQREAFIESDGQLRLTDKSVEQEILEEEPVECLGVTFESDEARRAHFLELLKAKLPELRARPDFPLGLDGGPAEDADILRLSDPPYFTACPNPFLTEFVAAVGQPYEPEEDSYHREPFAFDVSEGKNDPLYRLPSYYTKVPPRAIQRYLSHYTEPGDVILDAFCGSGMTGVATLTLSDSSVPGDQKEGGIRHVILADLSPLAAFTAHVMTSPMLPALASAADGEVARIVTRDVTPLYESTRVTGRGVTQEVFDYAVWSDWGRCDNCATTFRIYDVEVDYEQKCMHSTYACPECDFGLRSRGLEKEFTATFDPWIGEVTRLAKTTIVKLSRRVGNRAVRKTVSQDDEALAEEIGARDVARSPIPIPYSHMTHERNNLPAYWGITHIHHFYTRRNYWAIDRLLSQTSGDDHRAALFAVLTMLDNNGTRRNRFYVDKRRPNGSPVGPLSNTLYVPTVQVETNVGRKVMSVCEDAAKLRGRWPRRHAMVSTQSATILDTLPDNTVDFVFTDPPFGGNINYSEQSFLGEWWLGVFTNREVEAITNPAQKKDIQEYQAIMTQCFREYRRVLKPGRWMVIEFHNSANGIWVAIQQALEAAGLVVAAVSVLDKKQGTLHQDHKAGTVNKDLVITAYKPERDLETRFDLHAGTEEGAWDFMRTHLRHLPVFVSKDGTAEIIAERQNYLLFDRMVAFHVQRGVTVPLSATEFYEGLERRFPERDGMYFLPEQAAEYDRKRASVSDVAQVELFVKDEESAIQWLKQQLSRKPQTFQELQPQFMKQLSGWERHEQQLELSDLLEENFLRYEGKGEVPSQIHSYLSSNFKDLRGLEKDDPALRSKAKDRWYAPDPRKAGDLEKLRERSLLKEFEDYRTAKKRLKVFRLEAVRAGFKRAWQDRDYATIIAVAERIPERVLQEDPKLLMWYDQAVTRSGGG